VFHIPPKSLLISCWNYISSRLVSEFYSSGSMLKEEHSLGRVVLEEDAVG